MYLVTGGAGFIGSNIVRRLVKEEKPVRVLDNFASGKRENLKGLDNLEIIEGSLTVFEDVRRALDGVRYVLHQGAISSVPLSIADPIHSNEVNITGTLNLLVAANEARVKRVVFAASSSAYGDTEVLPHEETMMSNPLSPYAVGKYAGELYARVFSHIDILPTVSLRYFNIFGPYQDPASEYAAVIPKFIQCMLKGEQPTIYGDGEQTRDFLYVENVVNANLLACHANRAGKGEVINIASGARSSLNILVQLLNEIMETNITPRYADPRPGDVLHSQADITKAKSLLDYEVTVDFREGLRHTVEWYRQQGN
ncbi:MAG TPA: SDR family oxidoreductase [Dehalococcoidales bacterium]|nr:SDR family oxidoreductase [Dehalococcoidales bacterium]